VSIDSILYTYLFLYIVSREIKKLRERILYVVAYVS